jgi:L-fuculose-phosphate aldolase
MRSSRVTGRIFRSPEATALKREIVRVARKLWLRDYVDGNGGNISARLGDFVLCTPTLLSKGDVHAANIVMVDLDGDCVAGTQRPSSELSLHLAIMRVAPQARAVVHCHPPHATAFAITGQALPEWLLAEPEVFVGRVARVPYETPGSHACADAAAAQVADHNTMLLANHGAVCWADTPTHAEWYVEVLDTFCRVLLAAASLKVPLIPIPLAKARELLALKRGLGLPDARYMLSDEDMYARAPRPRLHRPARSRRVR